MDVYDAMMKRRTIRFYKDEPVDRKTVMELLDFARMAPSAANRQPMEYVVVTNPGVKDRLFGYLAFGAYVKPRRVPGPGKRPGAYVVVLWNRDKSSFPQWEVGSAVQNLMLAAVARGLGTCWLGGIDKDGVRRLLQVPENLDVVAVVALGRPAEEPVLEEDDQNIKYWLDDEDVLHVPKRSLDSMVSFDKYKVRK